MWDVTGRHKILATGRTDFYSHIPCGMWPRVTAGFQSPCTISTHTSRVGCDDPLNSDSPSCEISTHTSRVGCDEIRQNWYTAMPYFYSHIPCGMWHGLFYLHFCIVVNFYSHIPCGMWHTYDSREMSELINFYSHIPCGMWLHDGCLPPAVVDISTHTSRVGCDFL